MFCATFYSYKGGVGRSLALANVAVLLAQRGKKVLVVDFDLEAPGLTTLSPFQQADGGKGIVDLVSDYVESGKMPLIDDYIHTCRTSVGYDEANSWNDDISIDVMPAGRDGDDRYGQRLNLIDWNMLYEKQDGFLMMENIRAHWALRGYDYVLIDSRTGHTDVGGICTRQLPDIVVAVFFPNEQNLVGLRQVVRGVREDGARPKPIDLLFVASRVPRLDDEHGHLRKRMEKFQEELKYAPDQLVIIEHYDSLMLLNQSMFVLDRANSGLANQYRELAAQLVQFNDEDADGALTFLISVASGQKRLRMRNPEEMQRTIVTRLDSIGKAHRDDCIVQHELARACYRLRDLVSGADAVNSALASNPKTKTTRAVRSDFALIAHRLRLKILSELDRNAEALDSARKILDDSRATEPMVIDAMLAFASIDPEGLPTTSGMTAISGATAETLLAVARQLAQAPGSTVTAAELTEMALKQIVDVESGTVTDVYTSQLTLIAGGYFERAAMIAEPILTDSDDLSLVFNTAIARWGRDGRPDEAIFLKAAALFESNLPQERDEPNWYQCLALTNAVLGRTDAMSASLNRAKTAIERADQRDFSCWRYQLVTPAEFVSDLTAIDNFGKRRGPPPVVVTQKKGI